MADKDGCKTSIARSGGWMVACGWTGREFTRFDAGFADTEAGARRAARAAKAVLLEKAQAHRQRNIAAWMADKGRR